MNLRKKLGLGPINKYTCSRNQSHGNEGYYKQGSILGRGFLVEVIGIVVSAFPAVKYALVYYIALENDKIRALEIPKGESNSHYSVSDGAKDDLNGGKITRKWRIESTHQLKILSFFVMHQVWHGKVFLK